MNAVPPQRLAFVFPGQGSQAVGMLVGLAGERPEIRVTFAEASEVLGFDLWALVQHGPAAELDRTVNTQPALLAASVAVFRAWRAAGGAMPQAMAGHSLGEISALVCAGALGFADGLRLVRRRAELMQAAVPLGAGAMAAVLGAEPVLIEECCEAVRESGVVEPANDNAPGQIVIAGEREAVEAAIAWLAARGVRKVVRLPVSVPSHCSLMRAAAERFAAALGTVRWRMPQVPVIHNAAGRAATDLEELLALLSEQLYRPVRWRACVEALPAGPLCVAECGPGKVLCGLIRRIRSDVSLKALGEPEEFAAALGEWGGSRVHA